MRSHKHHQHAQINPQTKNGGQPVGGTVSILAFKPQENTHSPRIQKTPATVVGTTASSKHIFSQHCCCTQPSYKMACSFWVLITIHQPLPLPLLHSDPSLPCLCLC